MNKNVFIMLAILLLALTPIKVSADEYHKTGILEIKFDDKGHQALTFSVRSTPSSAPIQAFLEGWNIRIGSIEVFLGLTPDFSGVDRDYIIALTKEYKGGNATIFNNGTCIEDLVPAAKREEFYSIISRASGSTITVNARIQKYYYNSEN